VPLGRLADRLGPKRTWALGAVAGAAAYALWPLIHGFPAFLLMMVGLQVVESAGWSGRGAYALAVLPREEQVESMAFMRAALNVGLTLGALFSGVALAVDSNDLIRAVPIFSSVVLAVNALSITWLPDADHRRVPTVPGAGSESASQEARGGVLRNRGYVALSFCGGVLATNQVLLNIVIPLWLVQETDAPRVLLAWLFGSNTVLAVLLQVSAARGVDSVARSLRAARISTAFFVLSCLVVMVTHDTVAWVTIALLWLGHVTVTGAELFQCASLWGFMSELSDPDRLGEYQGASRLGSTLGSVWAPATYTYLAIEWGPGGWVVIAAIVLLATLGMGPAARAAERFLARDAVAAARPA
jgi:MFS family permease